MGDLPDSVWKPHATVAAVIESDGYYLLVEEICSGRSVFNQPAGHLEDGESLYDAVIREVREETTRQFHPQALVGCYRWREPQHKITYLRTTFCGSVGDEIPGLILDPDIVATHWLNYREISNHNALRSPLVLQCVDDYQAGKRFPLDFIHDIA